MVHKAFGEQSPTGGETAVSWQTWSDGAGGTPTISGDADWGKLQLDLNGAEGRSAVYDLGSAVARTFTLTKNKYGTGGTEEATLQIRGDTSSFNQDDESPTWETYTAAISRGWRYVQIREVAVTMLPQYLLTNTGTLVEDFETIGDWTATEGSVADDSTNYYTGSHSIAITSASGASGRAHKTVSLDMSAFGRGMCFYRQTASVGDYPSLYFSSDASFNNYIRYKANYAAIAIAPGWHVIHFHQDSMINDGSSPNLSSIIRFRCRQVAPSGEVRTVNFDSLYLGMVGVPAVCFLFEDIRDEFYDVALYMAAHNMRGTFSVVSDLVGDIGRCTWAQLREMEAMGHCLINATKNHTSLATLTEAQQEAEMTDCRDAGKANGIWAGANSENWRYLSYPNGSANADTITAFDAVGMRMGFDEVSDDGLFGMPLGQTYMLPMRNLTLATDLATMQARIDIAIEQGQLMMYYIEDMGGSSMTLETFEEVIDYMITRKHEFYCVTYDDLYKLQSGYVTIPLVT